MSSFGSQMGMGDFGDDFLFGSHMRSMRRSMYLMANSLLNDPFGLMVQNAILDGGHQARSHQDDMQMMPFVMPPLCLGMMGPGNGNNCHSYTSRSVMTMGSGPDGRPQVYQETMSSTMAPGGVKEVKTTVCDSRTGLKKMAIGHHIGDRAHILEREQNLHSGEQEERQEFINLEEEEAESFNHEWESRTRRAAGPQYVTHSHRYRPEHRQLALPDASGSRYSNSSRWTPSSRRSLRLPSTSKTYNTPQTSSSDSSGDTKSATKPIAAESSTNVVKNRKRERTPDVKVCKKRYSEPDSRI